MLHFCCLPCGDNSTFHLGGKTVPREWVLQTPPRSCCSGFTLCGALAQGENGPGELELVTHYVPDVLGQLHHPNPLWWYHLLLMTHFTACLCWQGCGTRSGPMTTKAASHWAKWSWPATMEDPFEVSEPWVWALHWGDPCSSTAFVSVHSRKELTRS